jgi:hypothetical protein
MIENNILNGLTELEARALLSAFKSSLGNGHEFGYADDVTVPGCNKQQNGALVTNLVKKGVVSVCRDEGLSWLYLGNSPVSHSDCIKAAVVIRDWLIAHFPQFPDKASAFVVDPSPKPTPLEILEGFLATARVVDSGNKALAAAGKVQPCGFADSAFADAERAIAQLRNALS